MAISLATSYALEIDWIKVTDDNTFLAAPVVRGASDFTNDGFTIHWDNVRRSYNYYIDLWKTVYTAPEGINVACDFEDQQLPEWIIAPNTEIAEGMGADGTTGLAILDNGVNGAVSTIDFGKKLDKFSLKFVMNLDMSDYNAVDWDNLPTLYIDGYGENGWEPFAELILDGYTIYPGYYCELMLDGEVFEGLYSGLRFYAANTDEDNLIYLDDLTAFAKRPYKLERVIGPKGAIYDKTDDEYDYNYYVYTDDPNRWVTSYTFTGLEPETEYWYRVRSHNVREFAGKEKFHAFGVAAPALLPATNITASSYTANWTDAPKAQKYTVNNYKAESILADEEKHSIMADNFSNCTGQPHFATMQPLDNNTECYLDEYTDLMGWRGKGNSMGQNLLGTEMYKGGYLITPPMMVNPERGSVYVYVEITGYYGEYLQIETTKSNLSAMVQFNEDGEIIGWLEMPAAEGDQIKFSTYYGYPFALSGFEVAQDVKAGDLVRVYASNAEVPAGEQAYTFSNLEPGIYCYSVVSHFDLEDQSAVSTSNEFITVDTKNGNTSITNKIELVGSDVQEKARYSVDGTRISGDFKGMILVEMNDGTVVKKVSK